MNKIASDIKLVIHSSTIATQYFPLLAGKPFWNRTVNYAIPIFIFQLFSFSSSFSFATSALSPPSRVKAAAYFTNEWRQAILALPFPLILYQNFLLLSALISALSYPQKFSAGHNIECPPPFPSPPSPTFLHFSPWNQQVSCSLYTTLSCLLSLATYSTKVPESVQHS